MKVGGGCEETNRKAAKADGASGKGTFRGVRDARKKEMVKASEIRRGVGDG